MSLPAARGQSGMTMTLPVEPAIISRPAQPYVAVKRSVTMDSIGEIADRIPEVFQWLGSRGIEPLGAPFLKYDVIDMERELEMEAGVPVAEPVPLDGAEALDGLPVFVAVLPAGRYATYTHLGHPDQLVHVTGAFLAWAADKGLTWDKDEAGSGERWGCRLEFYNTNPDDEPDMNKWETQLAFRLAD
jgi:hypothetical protein